MAFLLELIVPIIILTLAIIFSLLVTVPFFSLVIRYRAHYSPHALSLPLDPSAPEAPPPTTTGPSIRSLFSLFKRIRALEGWRGFYKGICPLLLESFVGSLAALMYWGLYASYAGPSYAVPPSVGLKAFGWAAFSLVLNLPMTIILNRCVTTPYRLPFSPVRTLRLILSPTELRRPWTLYLLPGLLPTKLLHIAYLVFLLPLARLLLVPSFRTAATDDTPFWDRMSITGFWGSLGLALYLVFLLASTAVLAPLEVIALRLSIQPADTTTDPTAPITPEDEAAFTGKYEDVIQLRTPECAAGEPYVGMVDCWRKICAEEGWRTLGRAAWLTALATLNAGFS